MIKVKFIRYATMIIEYGGKRFLVDPMLRAKGKTEEVSVLQYPQKPPLADLPMPAEEIVKDIDAVLMTHIHPGHFDNAAGALLSKTMPFYVQNINDKDQARDFGMKKTQTINMTLDTHMDDVHIIRVAGKHGDGKPMHIINTMQNSSGILLEKEDEQTVYITGDTMWCMGVEQGLAANPGLIIAYLGANKGEGMQLTMGLEELSMLVQKAPKAKILACHMDTFENQTLSRADVRAWVLQNSLQDRVLVPENGEELTF
ncbi:MAG: MBL fold metallo-hydrolase [Eubacterium sp.]|nr:MBL fold metallo-hydrolase [Eubacterium sp.]